MPLLSLFGPSCDVPDCHDTADWGEFPRASAIERAIAEGWHVRKGWYICEYHWDRGWRWTQLGQ